MQFSVVKCLVELGEFDDSILDVYRPEGDVSTAIRLKEQEIQENKLEYERLFKVEKLKLK